MAPSHTAALSRRSLPMQFSSTARHSTRRREGGRMSGMLRVECRTLREGAELRPQETSGSDSGGFS